MTRDDEAVVGRREQKKRETRRAIRDAALDLALQNGAEKLTVEAIAQTAGISPRTFFNYFASKEDALVTQAAETADQVTALLLERPADESPMRAFHKAILASDYFGTDPIDRERVLARQRLIQDTPSLMSHHLGKIAMVERSFAHALAQRMETDPANDMYPELLAAIAVSALRIAVRRWVAQGNQSLYELLDEVFERLEHMDADAVPVD
ncbi:TetR/AcrR family transcriptional regulator [Enteractinococcus fodinae]|uniref:AcrR family transcriptional regulator n=1 Tax=Enteractinococcus fodinae TaxID=684663 RepID=A0ABU2B5Q0_9MICC|nr:TetR family transcriptional regulator [Enteractinococcus fodinae]MDR7347724.1 AcrR family transcriptional regulator [Enteractinococcus fodinae]